MAIQGLRHTGNFADGERPKSWRETILRLYPNGKAPLTALTSAMKSRVVDDPEFNWWTKALQTRRVALAANLTTSNTLLTVTSGALAFKEGDILWVEETDERLRVSADPSSDTQLSVIRGYSGSTPATLDFDGAGVNPNMTCIGSAYQEGSLAPSPVMFDPIKLYNLTQIFRNTLSATRTAQKTRLRTIPAVKEAKRETLELHSIDMERAFWFGKRWEGVKDGSPIRTTDGIINFIDPNNVVDVASDFAAGLTMSGLEEYIYRMFQYGSSEKMVFCGNRALLTMQQVLRKNAQWTFTSGITEYGMNVSRITSPFGDLVLKTHPLFNQMAGGTNGGTPYYGVESWMFVLDMDNISYVNLADSDTKYEPKLEPNGMDGMMSGYLTEAGLEVHHPPSHFLMKNVIAAAADS